MSQPKNIDRLSPLPAELLGMIFRTVQNSGNPLLSPLSKSLLPFIQEPLFQTIRVTSYEALDFLCEAVHGRPELGGYVKTLMMRFETTEKSVKERLVRREAEDLRSPSNKVVRRLFQHLVELHGLIVTASARIATLILDPVVASTFLPRLRSLQLCSTFSSLRDPFHPSHYQSLQYYSELRSFKLNVTRTSMSIQLSPKPQVDSLPFRNGVARLSLSGPLSSSSTSVTNLLTSFGTLDRISLCDISAESNLYDLLDGFYSPGTLSYLELKRLVTDGGPPRGCINEKLARFRNLSTLIIGGSCSNLKPSFYSSLRSSTSLESILFSDKAPVSLKEVMKLVTGSGKMESLQSITFDNVKGNLGTKFEPGDEPYWDHGRDEFGVHPDWVLPAWSKDFSEEDLFDLTEVAAEEGIDVDGSAVEAIGVLAEYEDEVSRLEAFEEDYWRELDG